jgi:hypothetical protein
VTARFISLPAICCRYIHNQDWKNAQRVAEEHDPDSVTEVLLGQAKDVFNSKNYSHFESLMLRAQRPDLIIKQYQVRPSRKTVYCRDRRFCLSKGWTWLFQSESYRLSWLKCSHLQHAFRRRPVWISANIQAILTGILLLSPVHPSKFWDSVSD